MGWRFVNRNDAGNIHKIRKITANDSGFTKKNVYECTISLQCIEKMPKMLYNNSVKIILMVTKWKT